MGLNTSFFFFALILLGGCMNYAAGKYNDRGQFWPVNPRFSLADSSSFVKPALLRLEGIYILENISLNGKQIYPSNDTTSPLSGKKQIFRFLASGRCFSRSIPSNEDLPFPTSININDIDPQLPLSSLSYYTYKDPHLLIEQFIPIPSGGGKYHISYWEIKDENTLLERSKNQIRTYRFYPLIDMPRIKVEW